MAALVVTVSPLFIQRVLIALEEEEEITISLCSQAALPDILQSKRRREDDEDGEKVEVILVNTKDTASDT